jgi:hypothetical protein
MTVSAAQASAFYAEAIREGSVWAVRDEGGFPAPMNADGFRAMPFWSLRSRAERIISTAPAYQGFSPVEIPLTEFRDRWLPRLEADGLRVGVNWSGVRATGHDLDPPGVEQAFIAIEGR